jgi:hypothetical protein
MTVESLLKVMQKGTDVILKDKSEKELLRMEIALQLSWRI